MSGSSVSQEPPQPPKARNVAGWGVLDQIVSSGANFAFIVLVARTLAPAEFGSVSLAFEAYLLTVVSARGVAGDTLIARFSGREPLEVGAAIRAASGAPVVIGGLVAVALTGLALLVGDHLRGTLVVLAAVLPLLVLQDFVRQALIVQGRARAAFMNDLTWAILQLPALWLAITLAPGAAALLAAWGGAGCVTAVVGVAQLRVGMLPATGCRTWLRDHRALWPYLLGENLLYAAGSFIVVLTISAATGLAGLAAFRAAMTVYAPLATLGRGVTTVAVNLLARRRAEPLWIRRVALTSSCVMALTAVLWGALMTLLPDSVGLAGFGQSWEGARPLLFLASFPCATALFSVGASCGIRALDAGLHGFSARAAVSLTALVAFSGGVLNDGVRGAFEFFAWSTPLQFAIWLWLLYGATARAERAADPLRPTAT